MSARTEIATARLSTPLGPIWLLATAQGLREIRLGSRGLPTRREAAAGGVRYVHRPRWTDPARLLLREYLAGGAPRFELPLELPRGTPFERRVWEATRRVPYGGLTSYGALAAQVGLPRSARAVGNALGANPIPIVIPCHRVIHGDESLGGFSGGLPWKRYLIAIERGQLELEFKPRARGLMARLWRGA